jgi:hypothetical protein
MSEAPPISTLHFASKQLTLTPTLQALYVNETEKPSIVVTGTFSNTSDDTEQVHYVNLRLTDGGVSSWVFYQLPLVFGSTLLIPKLTLNPEAKIEACVTPTSSSGLVDAVASILEI